MKVEVLIASCCTPVQLQRKIVSVLEGVKHDVPDLEWALMDIEEDPELVVKYKAPMTPAIYIDGKLEFTGYPKQSALAAKVIEHSRRSAMAVS